MNNSRSVSFRAVGALACLLLTAIPLHAQTTNGVRYRSSPRGNTVKIDGDSSMHRWNMSGDLIGGFLEVPAGVTLDPALGAQPGITGGKLNARAEVSIPVTSLQSGTPEMDNVMQDALNAKDFRTIRFVLSEMTLKEPHTAGTPLEFTTKGDLTVAGVTNKISMPVRIESADKPMLKVTGSVPLKMTDFNVKPPVKVLVFRTTNDITVSFTWVITPPKPADGKSQ